MKLKKILTFVSVGLGSSALASLMTSLVSCSTETSTSNTFFNKTIAK